MAAVIKSVTFDAAADLALATFWAAVFGSGVDEDSTTSTPFMEAVLGRPGENHGLHGVDLGLDRGDHRRAQQLADPGRAERVPESARIGPVCRRSWTCTRDLHEADGQRQKRTSRRVQESSRDNPTFASPGTVVAEASRPTVRHLRCGLDPVGLREIV